MPLEPMELAPKHGRYIPVEVAIGTGGSIETSQQRAVDLALIAAAQSFGESVTAYKLLDPDPGTEAETAHLLALVLLSEKTRMGLNTLADELGYEDDAAILETTEKGYELAEAGERERFENIQEKYESLLGGLLTKEEQRLFEAARAGGVEAYEKLIKRFDPIISETMEGLDPHIPEDDALKIALKAAENLINTFDIYSPVDVNQTLREMVANKLTKFSEIVEKTELVSMTSYLPELVGFEEQFSDETAGMKPSIDNNTEDSIVRSAFNYLEGQFVMKDEETTEGVPIRRGIRRQRQVLKREINASYERTLRTHVFNSAIMKEIDWYQFDLTQMPTDKLAIFLAHSLKGILRKSTSSMTDEIKKSLDKEGYVPFV